MKSIKILRNLGIALFAIIALLVNTACDNENEVKVVDSRQNQNDKCWNEKFGKIDEAQDWCLIDSAIVDFAVTGLDALSQYQLQVYTDDPLFSTSARLIASTEVITDENGCASESFVADIVKGSTVFYACYIDKDNRRYIKPVALIDGKIDVQFGVATRASKNADNVTIKHENEPTEVNDQRSSAKAVNLLNCNENWSGSANFAKVLAINEGSSWTGSIPVLGSSKASGNLNRILYVDGTWTVHGNQNIGDGGVVVVGPKGKIIIPVGAHLKSDNSGRIVVFKGGVIEGMGSLTFHNGSAGTFDYNAGTINVGCINNNGGYVYNYGEIKATQIEGGAGMSVYVNHGKMKVDHSTYGSTTANTRIWNACQFEAVGNLCLRNIILGNSGYAHVGGNLLMSCSADGTSDNSEVLMAANSMLDVEGGIALNNTSIVGPTSGWAICQFGQIGDPYNQVATNYTTSWNGSIEQIVDGYVINNLYISIDKTETIDNYWSLTPYGKFVMCMLNGRLYDVAGEVVDYKWTPRPVYRANATAGNGAAVIVKKNETNIYIPEGDCHPGYTGAKATPVAAVPQSFLFGCEDFGSVGDYDFNDVVFSVSHVAGQTKVIVTPMAAGGTVPAILRYDGKVLGEIHNLLGETNTTMIINTYGVITTYGEPVELNVKKDWVLKDSYKKFDVVVTKEIENTEENRSVFITAPTLGKAPFMIIVPENWEWPLERVNIEVAYPDFTDWSLNSAVMDQWILHKSENMTVVRKDI